MTTKNRLAAIAVAIGIAVAVIATSSPASAQTEPPSRTTDGTWDVFEPQPYVAYHIQRQSYDEGIKTGWLVAESVVPEGHSCPVWIASPDLDDTGPHAGLFTGEYTIYGAGEPVIDKVIHALVFEAGSRIMFEVHPASFFVVGADYNDDLCRFTFHHRDLTIRTLDLTDTPGGLGDPFDSNTDPDFLPGPPPGSPFGRG